MIDAQITSIAVGTAEARDMDGERIPGPKMLDLAFRWRDDLFSLVVPWTDMKKIHRPLQPEHAFKIGMFYVDRSIEIALGDSWDGAAQAIIGWCHTRAQGTSLLAEHPSGRLSAISYKTPMPEGWVEVTREEWDAICSPEKVTEV